jgi:hypothetical protein
MLHDLSCLWFILRRSQYVRLKGIDDKMKHIGLGRKQLWHKRYHFSGWSALNQERLYGLRSEKGTSQG